MVEDLQHALGPGPLDGVVEARGQVHQDQRGRKDGGADDLPGVAGEGAEDDQHRAGGQARDRSEPVGEGVEKLDFGGVGGRGHEGSSRAELTRLCTVAPEGGEPTRGP